MIEYKIVGKAQFTLIGVKRKFNTNTSYVEIPKFWQEFLAQEGNKILGMYGVCEMVGDDEFDYYIADLYNPNEDIPDGCETKVIPAGTWAVFPCRGALPKSLQNVNTRIWTEWLPTSKEYRPLGSYDLEMYTEPKENPEDDYSEIWIPIQKVVD